MDENRVIQSGAVYWLQPDSTRIPHPHVVIYSDASPLVGQVIVCAITTNRRKISMPANILLEAGEANLPSLSIIEVSKYFMIHQSELGGYIGLLSSRRVEQIISGIAFLRTSFGRSS